MGKIYFAHPVNTYNTPFEQAMVKLLKAFFPEDEIENPNQPHHQEGYRKYAELYKHEPIAKGTRGMRYFHEVVLPSCDKCAILPFLDGRLGLGAADEPRWYLERGMPAWFIEPTREATREDLERFINDPLTSNLFRIRPFTKQEVEMLCDVDPKIGSPLVVPHEETRLRTWIVYNRERRPYETAHLVKLPIPEGFYPDK
jgi:hypothetical protein